MTEKDCLSSVLDVGKTADCSTSLNYSIMFGWFSRVLEDPVGGMDSPALRPGRGERATLLPDEPKRDFGCS